MKRKSIAQVVAWIAVVGLCVPQLALAATPAGQKPAVLDVALQPGQMLVGQVVDAQGKPVANMLVSLESTAGRLAQAKTDQRGYFAFRGLRPGVYQLATPAGAGTYRVWTQQAAPPSARPGVLVVSTGDAVRGNVFGLLGQYPLITAALIAAAIAIPIAVTADRGPSSP